MNLETVAMCAQFTARQQLAALGCVSEDVQALIDELTPAPVVEEESVGEDTPAEAVVEETPAEPAGKKRKKRKTATAPAAE